MSDPDSIIGWNDRECFAALIWDYMENDTEFVLLSWFNGMERSRGRAQLIKLDLIQHNALNNPCLPPISKHAEDFGISTERLS